jgi:hypothetical protein
LQNYSNIVRFLAFAVLLWLVIAMGSCAPARTILQQADLSPDRTASARLDNPSESFKQLETALYGPFTQPTVFDLSSSNILATDWLDGKATVEQRVYNVSHGQTPQVFKVVVVTPNASPDAPVIISQNFSPNRSVITAEKQSPLPGENGNMGLLEPVFKFFFGRHIIEPPLENIIDRGYSFVAMHPPDYVADRSKKGTEKLNLIFGDRSDRPGALTIWASLSTALATELKQQNPDRPVIAYGHSRYGKTALLAAAYGQSIDAAVSHQSGTAGASLMRDKTGESIKDVVRGYPHWLSPAAAEYADTPRSLPTDAHALLAAISPKPILLGNARRDVWSDPEGAFRAAQWAAANTDQTFTSQRLDDFQPTDDIAFWTRTGTHGVVKEDWATFLDFLDAHFK